MDYRIEYCRYSPIKGSRKRTDFVNGVDTIEDGLAVARSNCRAWNEIDLDHDYTILSVSVVGHSGNSDGESSIGWETSEEWTARTAEKKG